MPEGLEAEIYRRHAERALDREIATVEVDPNQPAAFELTSVLPGLRFARARRHGKHVLLDTAGTTGDLDGPVVALHFGMTGRLIVDGGAAISELEYASTRDDPAWDRFVVTFRDGGVVRVNDPRRWARFELDPDMSRLGPDLFAVDADALGTALSRRRAALKTILLDQAVIAGLGNLCVDEVLWQAGLAPSRPANTVRGDALDRLYAAMRDHLPEMLARGGSHRGVISPDVRAAVPPCPRDGSALRREAIAGRTTVWCPAHQT